MSALPRPLRGIIPPIVTPLMDRDSLDLTACEGLVESMIAGGVSGIFALGTTGEAPGLSYRLRRELLSYVCRFVNGRVPVLAGITDTSIVESLAMACHAAKAGAAGLVLAPPYYYRNDQDELLRYVQRLVPELPLPVYLYNIPVHTKTHFAPATVRAAAELAGVYGVKDSSGDMGYFRELIAAVADVPDFSVLCGPEEMLAEAIAMGAHGGISGGSNLAPRLYVELYRAAVAGDARRTRELQAIVMEISRRVYHAGSGDSAYLRGMKCAMSLLGRCRNVMAEPHEPFGSELTEEIGNGLKEIRRGIHEEFL